MHLNVFDNTVIVFTWINDMKILPLVYPTIGCKISRNCSIREGLSTSPTAEYVPFIESRNSKTVQRLMWNISWQSAGHLSGWTSLFTTKNAEWIIAEVGWTFWTLNHWIRCIFSFANSMLMLPLIKSYSGMLYLTVIRYLAIKFMSINIGSVTITKVPCQCLA